MKWMEFVATLVGHLAWPVTLVVLYVMLRDKIAALLQQLARLKYKDLELDFEKVRKHAEELTNASSLASVALNRAQATPALKSLEEQITDTAETAPSASILLAWSSIETALATAVSRLAASPDAPSSRSAVHNIEMLLDQGSISRRQVKLLTELRSLRNKVAHDSGANSGVSEKQALEYASAARALVAFLNGLDRTYKIVETPTGKWIELPSGFAEVARRQDVRLWKYSAVQLKDSGLTAGVGPWMGPDPEEIAYYGIDVELPTVEGSKTVAELLLDVKFVDPVVLKKRASEIVRFDPVARIVTFDLGKSVLRYQINEGL